MNFIFFVMFPIAASYIVSNNLHFPSIEEMEDTDYFKEGNAIFQNSGYQSSFEIDPAYDYSKSTEINYRIDYPNFVGKYIELRKKLDYSYHNYYSEKRQLFQDQLIDTFLKTKVIDKYNNSVCEFPLENWIVFTAGPMGAGKGHTLEWLNKKDLFPLEAFVMVDPDALRAMLPEINQYNELDGENSGYLTQKEVGYISEILILNGLNLKKNVLVDGSLRDADWYLQYFNHLRFSFPKLKIAILSITASVETVFLRAAKRAKITGRIVPEKVLLDTINKIPKSLEKLVPQTDFYAHISNENNCEPQIDYCEMKHNDLQSIVWTMKCDKNQIVYYDEDSKVESIVEDWKEVFREVWVMQCGFPLHVDHHHIQHYQYQNSGPSR